MGAAVTGRIIRMEQRLNPRMYFLVSIAFDTLQLDGRASRFYARLDGKAEAFHFPHDGAELPGPSRIQIEVADDRACVRQIVESRHKSGAPFSAVARLHYKSC